MFAFAAAFLLAGATPLDGRSAESSKCYTTHTGYFEEGPSPFGLNSGHHVVYPATTDAPKFKVHFQRCTQLTRYGKVTPFIYWGRIVAVEGGRVKANQCLTSTPSSTSGILYAKLADCGNDSNPPTDQSWSFITDDIGRVILFVRTLLTYLQLSTVTN
ncbi:hypothetical protein HWV62_40388 [Athelia sp. TMB]|nr:hypothetical protein HWV62_40388 [Athelia sp. TMB]